VQRYHVRDGTIRSRRDRGLERMINGIELTQSEDQARTLLVDSCSTRFTKPEEEEMMSRRSPAASDVLKYVIYSAPSASAVMRARGLHCARHLSRRTSGLSPRKDYVDAWP